MTGDKPDERLRTPMQWSRAPGLGFTTGTPWEASQGDTATTNVAAQDADRGSLLNLYRTLIHLRAQNPALARGTLIPLTTGNDAVVAYLRREGGRAVVVIANLGDAVVQLPALSSARDALQPRRYDLSPLMGGSLRGPILRIDAGGRIDRWVPVARMKPRQVNVIVLSPGLRVR